MCGQRLIIYSPRLFFALNWGHKLIIVLTTLKVLDGVSVLERRRSRVDIFRVSDKSCEETILASSTFLVERRVFMKALAAKKWAVVPEI